MRKVYRFAYIQKKTSTREQYPSYTRAVPLAHACSTPRTRVHYPSYTGVLPLAHWSTTPRTRVFEDRKCDVALNLYRIYPCTWIPDLSYTSNSYRAAKKAVQSVVKVELTTTMLHEREKNQESEEAEQTASPTIHSEQLGHPQPKRTKLEKFFDGTFRPRAGENGSATEVATTELQKYELEEPLGLENK